MTTLFDIGDEIKVTLQGVVKQYSIEKSGDCYIIELTNIKPEGTRVYLGTPELANATKINEQIQNKNPEIIHCEDCKYLCGNMRCSFYGFYPEHDWFCGTGVRRDE